MAKALPAGRPVRRRALFGFFDSDGWAWATTKAFFWLLVIILTLGYIPDRAYYFVVSRTIDLGILGWSPVNLCPPENGSAMPCPVPAGAVLPWQASPAEAALPAARTEGAAAQLGTNLLYIGGLDGTAPSDDHVHGDDRERQHRRLVGGAGSCPRPAPNAGIAILSGTVYLVGGDRAGRRADRHRLVARAGPRHERARRRGPRLEDVDAARPARRRGRRRPCRTGSSWPAGSARMATPTATVWKSTLDDEGKLGGVRGAARPPAAGRPTRAWRSRARSCGSSAARTQNGPTDAVQRADYGSTSTATGSAAPGQPSAAATARGSSPEPRSQRRRPGRRPLGHAGSARATCRRRARAQPASPRTARCTSSAAPTGTTRTAPAVLGAARTRTATSRGWRHLDATDLPEGRADAAPVVSGSTALLLGGTVNGGRHDQLGPGEPRAAGAVLPARHRRASTVPALQIGGEIGQQLGYLAAAGVGTGNFVILIVVGWAFNNRPQISRVDGAAARPLARRRRPKP